MKNLLRLFAFLVLSTFAFAQTQQQPATTPPPKRPRAGNLQDKINSTSAGKTAQSQRTDAQKEQPQQQSGMAMAPVSPEMEKIGKRLVGRWRAKEQHEPTPWNPNGGQGSGMETVTYGPGRHSLMFQYNSSGPLGRFEGRGIWVWDPAIKAFKTAWVDNTAPMLANRTGNWQGDKLVFTGSDDVMGTKMDFRETFSDWTDTSFTFTMEMSPAGANQWKKAMTVTYHKLGGAMMPSRMSPQQQQPAAEKQ